MSKKKKAKGFNYRPYYDRILMPINIFTKIRALTETAEGEISGFGRTKLVEDSDHYYYGSNIQVEEFDVFEQECQTYHTTLKSEDMTQMYVGVAQNGGDPSQWNFWWHSHVDMPTGFSGEDDETMKNITRAKNGQRGSMLVAICTNKRGDYDATVYHSGRRLMERIPLIIVPDITGEVQNEVDKIIKDKVTYNNPVYHPLRNALGQEEEFDFDPDITIDDHISKVRPKIDVVEPGDRVLSKNQRRKMVRHGKNPNTRPFKREKGWAVRPS